MHNIALMVLSKVFVEFTPDIFKFTLGAFIIFSAITLYRDMRLGFRIVAV